MSLNGKRVVVLGGSSGLGLAVAQAAAGEGADIVMVSSHQARLDAALKTLPKGGESHAVNLREEKQIRALFDHLGAFDHLVYTAGESLRLGTLAEVTIDQARDFFDLRLWGAVTAVKYATPNIRAGGAITLTTGSGGYRPRSGWVVPAGVLGAMGAITRALAVELAPLRVNAVCPGVVRTALWDNMTEAARQDFYQTIGAKLLVGRVGEAEDVAQTYLYLMKNNYSTGQNIIIDGGTVLV
ncbi:MAG: SDR family oxidoreductase [Dongiaceae bacterium]